MTYPVIPDRPSAPEHPVDQDVLNQVAVEEYVSDWDDRISSAICGQVFSGHEHVSKANASNDVLGLNDYLSQMVADMPDEIRGLWAHALDPSIPTFAEYKVERYRRAEDRWELCMAAWLAHREYPQYATAFRGPEWRLVRVLRRVRTKAGLSFSAGEETIAKVETSALNGHQEVLAYSFHTRVTTLLGPSDVEWLT